MLHVDVLSGYFICGAGSLVGAAMLRIAEASDARTHRALRLCGWGFVLLGLGLMPSGLGEQGVSLAAAQFSLAFGTLTGMLLIGAGLGEVQGKRLRPRWIATAVVFFALGLALALQEDRYAFGVAFVVGMVAVSSLMVWLMRGMILRGRDVTEHAMAASMIVLVVSCWTRLAFTLAHRGGVRADLMYLPPPFDSVLAARLRLAIEGADWVGTMGLASGVTVSVGVAMVSPAESLDAALQRADEALYRAKRDGRNQCQIGLAVA